MKKHLKAIVAGGRRFGPYLALELFVPGGTLLAILYWLRERRKAAA